MKKLAVLLAAVMAYGTTAFGCWYKFYNYQDYIYAINNREVHTQQVIVTDKSQNKVQYTVKNNMVVDFPISVSVKLVSNDEVVLSDENGNQVTVPNELPNNVKKEIISCALQYRVLPNGNWVTVQKYETASGTIPNSYPPNFYFGRNNIFPKCKKGDVIMIRLYVTDGIWQSGDPASMCADKLVPIENPVANITQESGKCMSLNGSYTFNLEDGARDYNLGGNWAPNLVTTVIWSGKTRAVK